LGSADVEWLKRVRGAVAVITGAASGMGQALARNLGAAGCNLALADVDEAGLEHSCRSILADHPGLRVTGHRVDVADEGQMEAFAAAVLREHGGVNLLFNNAGVAASGFLEQLPSEDFEWLMGINFWGVIYGCRVFLPALHDAEWGHIVNTSSIFGLVAVPTQSAYHAAKFAVRGVTEALSQELRDTPIAVSCVLPGGVKTNIVRRSRYVASDNQAPTREEIAAQFEALAGLTAEEAAAIILRGVARRRRRILVGRDAQLIAALVYLLPVRYLDVVAWLMKRRGRWPGQAAADIVEGQGEIP